MGHRYVSEFFSSHWSGNKYAGTWQNQASSLKIRTRSHFWEVLDQVLRHLLVFRMQKRFQWTLMHSPKDTRTEMCPSSEKNFCFEKKENSARNSCAWAAVLLFMKVGKVWQEWQQRSLVQLAIMVLQSMVCNIQQVAAPLLWSPVAQLFQLFATDLVWWCLAEQILSLSSKAAALRLVMTCICRRMNFRGLIGQTFLGPLTERSDWAF